MSGYNPGNQNNSGQILAQSINGAVDNVAQGYQTFQQNNLLASQAMAKFQAAASANPEMVAYLAHDSANPELGSIYNKLTKGGAVNFKDAAALSTFADSFAGAKLKKQEMDLNAAKLQDYQQQMAAQRNEAVLATKDAGAFNAAISSGSQKDPAKFLQTYVSNGGRPAALKTLGFDLDKFLFNQGGKIAPVTFPSMAALQSQFPPDKYDYKLAPQPDGTVIAEGISPRAPIAQTMEPGFMADPNKPGAVIPIPGSDAEAKRVAAVKVDAEKQTMSADAARDVLDNINKALPKINNFTTGILGGKLTGLNQDAADLKASLESISSGLSVDFINDMRASAASNGSTGIGKLMLAELQAVATSKRNVANSQSKEQLKQNLLDLQEHLSTLAALHSGAKKVPDRAAPAAPLSPVDSILGKYGIPPKK